MMMEDFHDCTFLRAKNENASLDIKKNDDDRIIYRDHISNLAHDMGIFFLEMNSHRLFSVR